MKIGRKLFFFGCFLLFCQLSAQRLPEYYFPPASFFDKTNSLGYYQSVGTNLLFRYTNFSVGPPFQSREVPVFLRPNGVVDTMAQYFASSNGNSLNPFYQIANNLFFGFGRDSIYQFNQGWAAVDYQSSQLPPGLDFWYRSDHFYRDSTVYFLSGLRQNGQPVVSDTCWLLKIPMQSSQTQVDTIQPLFYPYGQNGKLRFNIRASDSTIWVQSALNALDPALQYSFGQAAAISSQGGYAFEPGLLGGDFAEVNRGSNGYFIWVRNALGKGLDSAFIPYSNTLIDESFIAVAPANSGWVVALSEAYILNGDTLLRGTLHFLNGQLQLTHTSPVISIDRNFVPRAVQQDPAGSGYYVAGESFNDLITEVKPYQNLDLRAALIIVDSRGYNARTIAVPAFESKPVAVLYPNPCQDFLNLRLTADEATYSIISGNGQLMQKGQWAKGQKISTAHLAKGVYTLKIQSKRGENLGSHRFKKH